MKKFTKTLLAIGVLLTASLACNQAVTTPAADPIAVAISLTQTAVPQVPTTVPAISGSSPEEVEVPQTPAEEIPTDTILGDWQGSPLTVGKMKRLMVEAGWSGLVDYVSEAVENYGYVSRLIFGGNPEEQAHALEVANAVAQKFSGTLWYVYGTPGSGKECGWRSPQQDLHLLRIEVYSSGAFLPEITSCRPAP